MEKYILQPQDVDLEEVMLLYRPELYGIDTEAVSKYPSEGLGVVIVAKQRNGQTGDAYFGCNKSLTKIGDYIPPELWMKKNAQ